MFATIQIDRTNPQYDLTAPAGYPDSYDYGGSETVGFNGVVPFIGVQLLALTVLLVWPSIVTLLL